MTLFVPQLLILTVTYRCSYGDTQITRLSPEADSVLHWFLDSLPPPPDACHHWLVPQLPNPTGPLSVDFKLLNSALTGSDEDLEVHAGNSGENFCNTHLS